MGDPEGGTFTYRILPEPILSRELARMAHATTLPSTHTDHVTFQPCSPLEHENEDRLVAEEWDIPGYGSWIFNAVLDGHVNSFTVDYVTQNLPRILRRDLGSALAALRNDAGPDAPYDGVVPRVLQKTIVYVDEQIYYDLTASPETLVNHFAADTEAYQRAARCLGGCTVVLSLTDPARRLAWVAALGAVVRRSRSTMTGTHVNKLHNARSEEEVAYVRSLHPTELSVISDERVLGYLEPTRGFGDMWLKRPKLAALLMSVNQEWLSTSSLAEYGVQVLHPPYILNTPDVHTIRLDEPNVDEYFLILASDGLGDCDTYVELEPLNLAVAWANVLHAELAKEPTTEINFALSLLRAALGGSDERLVSRNMTVEMDDRWMDDTTIIVQRIQNQSRSRQYK
ncbi:protein serine/threonine phosphatase 2C [Schizophyllum commune H4-8]|uniref:protein serine/threonine phosphatase 2C n=1 Tax=Schizophyllum commune (strain H4-8 / FGSC 9210) TaxID=578458 RepID=UPI00215E36FA|nr:protein serine/threonine phosphatase 2C [Schizophyllum commune H4-8]KAI5890873.1 protein serine/threonine phosphatase 2C [Schizophyllum commune H4-8]